MTPNGDRLVPVRELTARLGVSRVSLYRWTRDGTFPRPVQLSERRIAWREWEVEAWLASRPVPAAYASSNSSPSPTS